MLPIGRKSVWSWFKLNVVILHVSLVSVAETSSCLPNILSHLFPYQYDHVYIYMGGLQCVQLKGCVSQPLLQMGGSLKSLVRLPGRIVKEGSQRAAPCAISLPPSCLQCDCEGRSSGSCLWPQGQGPQPMVEHTAGGKLGSWWHDGMSTLSHTGHRLTLHETERNPLLAYLGFQTKHNPMSGDHSSWAPEGCPPCHVHCKTTVFGTNFLDLKHQYLVLNSGPQPLVMDL